MTVSHLDWCFIIAKYNKDHTHTLAPMSIKSHVFLHCMGLCPPFRCAVVSFIDDSPMHFTNVHALYHIKTHGNKEKNIYTLNGVIFAHWAAH